MKDNQATIGILYALGAYFLWGFLPMYWKLADHVPAGQVLAHRIIWAFAFMVVIILLTGKQQAILHETKEVIRNKRRFWGIALASILISLNWLTFIWAVNSDHVIQASLGYYINPLVSILLGAIVLKERFNGSQIVSFILAACGVVYLTISYGVFPWVSLILAFSFAFYGLLKKIVQVSTMTGLTIETLMVTPIALIYLSAIPANSFTWAAPLSTTNLILAGSGAATAIPLLMFASGAKQIPLAMVGFLQYIAPTIMLLLGVFLYQEPFTQAHLVAFVLIWTALIIYMASTYRRSIQTQKSLKKTSAGEQAN
ncbi:EamA family transporter RarD [Virgibacillus xinjiangensis]|uniref:EamA family transporter RarD n=1 Tax=Virgibacillus xinjiangensis TaxID=393090 RepID=A0ABV7CTW0_9BACI